MTPQRQLLLPLLLPLPLPSPLSAFIRVRPQLLLPLPFAVLHALRFFMLFLFRFSGSVKHADPNDHDEVPAASGTLPREEPFMSFLSRLPENVMTADSETAPRYSTRSAAIGLDLAARHAGKAAATSVTTSSAIAAPVSTPTSRTEV